MAAEVALQRLLAGNESKAASQLLRHEVSSPAHLVFARLGDKVLGDELARRDTSDSDGTFDDRENDLNGEVNY